MQKHFVTLCSSLLLFLFISQPLCALQPITDSEMGAVTGRAGVSMVIDDMGIYQYIEAITYRDPDGTDYSWYDNYLVGETDPAYIRLQGFNLKDLEINAIDIDGQKGTKESHFKPSSSQDAPDLQFRPITLDVATNIGSLFWGTTTDTRTGLVIGLPTMEIYLTELSIQGIYADSMYPFRDKTVDPHEHDYHGYGDHTSFSQIKLTGADIAFLDGRVALMSHKTGRGVDIGMDDVQIYIKIDELRFTDDDGNYFFDSKKYQNTPQVTENGDMAIPFSIAIRDIEVDTLRINSLYFTCGGDGTAPAVIDSPGKVRPHAAPQNLKQSEIPFQKNTDGSLRQGDIYGCPLQIDIGSNMPIATAFDVANKTPRTIIGISVSLPTLELFAKQASIGGIYVSDPSPSPDKTQVLNNEASFTQVRIDNGLTSILSGKLEIYNSYDR